MKRAFWRMQQRIQFLFNFLALEGYMEGSGMQATLRALLSSYKRQEG